MTEEQKQWIDNAGYVNLLLKWRYAPFGDPMLQDECGEYFAKALHAKRKAEGPDAHVLASKVIDKIGID